LQVFFVRRDQLREYQPGSDPSKLLSDFGELNYPVVVNDQVRSSVVVVKNNGRWQMGEIGESVLAKLIARYRKSEANQPSNDPEFLVHVGALGFYFLGRYADARLQLTLLSGEPNTKLQVGSSLPADQVFAFLATLARSQNDSSPHVKKT